MSTHTITVYGIPQCDTVRKARAWLAARGVEHQFHDFKKLGVPPGALQRWMQSPQGPRLLNRQGTTWRRLDAAEQARAADAPGTAALLQAHPSLIKRPVVDWGDALTVGFDEAAWNERLAQRSNPAGH